LRQTEDEEPRNEKTFDATSNPDQQHHADHQQTQLDTARYQDVELEQLKCFTKDQKPWSSG
jgi:hypothetical protein